MNGRELVVGVTGGIAAYKTAALVSQLVQAGAGVTVVHDRLGARSSSARHVRGAHRPAGAARPCFTSPSFRWRAHRSGHARRASVRCARPRPISWPRPRTAWPTTCSARCCLAFTGPVMLAPAMNCEMWDKPAVQRNVEQLREDGVITHRPGRRAG